MNTQLPGLPKDELRAKWNALSGDYDGAAWLLNDVLGVKRMRRRLFARASGKILDIACGTGHNFPYFPAGIHLTAIDLSEGMLSIARQYAEKLGLTVDLRVMDAEHLDFADASFDTVVSALSTCTIPDPVAALREMARVCRPGGQILMLEHGVSSNDWICRYQHHNPYVFYRDGCRWNQNPLTLAEQAGLEIVASRRSLFGIMYAITAKAAPVE